MVGMSFIELLILLVVGGSPLNLPISLPPLPSDTAVVAAAPPECLWYLSWAGTAKPDPDSPNHTEQLLAEREVQRLMTELETRLRNALRKGAPNQQGIALAENATKLIKITLTRPVAIFIESAVISPAGPAVQGGAIISAGEQADEARQSLDKLLATLLPPEAGADGKQTPGGNKARWRRLPVPQGAPLVEFGWHKTYFIIGIGEGSADKIVERTSASPPEWLTHVRKELAVDRIATVHYLNVQSALASVGIFGGLEGLKIINALGVDRVKYLANVTGLDKNAMANRAVVRTEGQPRGLFALLESEPLKLDDLRAIPKDATWAIAAKVDAQKVMNALRDLVGIADPQGKLSMDRELERLEQETGFHIIRDLLGSLGNTWTIYSSPGEGSLVITGITAAVPVRNRDELLNVQSELAAIIRRDFRNAVQANGGQRRGMALVDFEFAGERIYFLNGIGIGMPIAPAWCITKNELIVSLYPQMIKARLSRGKDAGSLADLPDVARQFKNSQAPSALAYQNTPEVFRLVYPVLHVLAGFLCGELQKEGLDIDISLLPSAAAIEKHLLPSISAAYVAKDGIEVTSETSLPIAGGAAPALGAATFMLFAARASHSPPEVAFSAIEAASVDLEAVLVPGAAARNRSINNLRQIAIALHNFHDVHKRFPAADGAGRDSKPRLSWRVHILPFVEEQSLFQEFKLDEPWDSEHNKKLIQKMPKVYEAPGSKVANEHKTNYLAIRGKDTILTAGKGTRLADIRDGTANTVMVVEASDEKAVVWTKPDDFEPDSEHPIKGLVGLRDSGFLALFGDASVRFINESLSKDKLQAIFTRSGGEAVELE